MKKTRLLQVRTTIGIESNHAHTVQYCTVQYCRNTVQYVCRNAKIHRARIPWSGKNSITGDIPHLKVTERVGFLGHYFTDSALPQYQLYRVSWMGLFSAVWLIAHFHNHRSTQPTFIFRSSNHVHYRTHQRSHCGSERPHRFLCTSHQQVDWDREKGTQLVAQVLLAFPNETFGGTRFFREKVTNGSDVDGDNFPTKSRNALANSLLSLSAPHSTAVQKEKRLNLQFLNKTVAQFPSYDLHANSVLRNVRSDFSINTISFDFILASFAHFMLLLSAPHLSAGTSQKAPHESRFEEWCRQGNPRSSEKQLQD